MEDMLNNIMSVEEETKNIDINNIISSLELYSNDLQNLTMIYTNILTDENIVYILTRVSQNPIFLKHFPEFYSINESGESVINCQQNSIYHQYGVFKHILYTIEYVGMENKSLDLSSKKILKWTMLLHDIGKPFVKTTNQEGRDSFMGHDDASVEIAKEILERFDFSDYEKRTILTLIKYHDRYLNDGELTQDNFLFLAEELENKRELFELLIEVKIADNKAKSIDVFKKFQIAVKKYYEFLNSHFPKEQKKEQILLNDKKENLQEDLLKSEEKNNKKIEKNGKVTDENFEKIYKYFLNENSYEYFYQPVWNLQKNEMFGYEISATINVEENVKIEDILLKSRDFKKYDRVQQLMFINSINNLYKITDNKMKILKIDLESYMEYVNKGRIFDLLDKRDIVIAFVNYEKLNQSEFKKIIAEIKLKGGKVLLDDYDDTQVNVTGLDILDPDYIRYNFPIKMEKEKIIEKISSLNTYCVSSDTRLIINKIEDKKSLDVISESKVDLVQGEYLSDIQSDINFDKAIKRILLKINGEDEEIF